MASARYTLNIKPEDLKPDEPRQLTRKEKAANWWYYHRLHVGIAAAVDVYTQVAGLTTLSGDINARTSLIFLTDDPESFQASFELLAAADGSLPEEGSGLESVELFAFSDCPALDALDLSEETRAYLERFYLSRRGFAEGKTLAEHPDENQALYELLTAGACAR